MHCTALHEQQWWVASSRDTTDRPVRPRARMHKGMGIGTGVTDRRAVSMSPSSLLFSFLLFSSLPCQPSWTFWHRISAAVIYGLRHRRPQLTLVLLGFVKLPVPPSLFYISTST